MHTENVTIDNAKAEEYLDKLFNQYCFSRTEISTILQLSRTALKDVTTFTPEQRKQLAAFYYHIRMINNLLNHQEAPEETASWFTTRLHQDFSCKPYDIYLKNGFLAVLSILQNEDTEQYLQKFYPEYRKNGRKTTLVTAEDGVETLIVHEKEQQ